jgi:SAM-dependent methyltransferase
MLCCLSIPGKTPERSDYSDDGYHEKVFHPQGPTFWELARQALSSTQRGYDLLAPKFDYTPFRTPDRLLEGAAELIAPRGPFERAIDLGCGTGAGLMAIRQFSRRLVGVDFSQGMLSVCRSHGGARVGERPIDLVRADLLALPFAESFDLAICFGVLGHIRRADEEGFLSEVRRTLRPGGHFVFLSSFPPPAHSTRFWFSHAFNAAMHIRNFLHAPPFHMYYLNFLVPEIADRLGQIGFSVQVRELPEAGAFPWIRLVIATRLK